MFIEARRRGYGRDISNKHKLSVHEVWVGNIFNYSQQRNVINKETAIE